VAEAIAKQIRVDVIDLSAARAGCRINGMQEAADAAIAEVMAWQPIENARKDGTPIWAVLHSDIYPRIEPGREDLRRWNGLQLPIRHAGLCEDGFDIGWGVAAPVGHGGFPDEWIAGYLPLPSPPNRGEK
jgi:hypothetical protein